MEYLRASICRIVLRYEFHAMKVNFHSSYLDIDWGVCIVAFVGAGIPLMEYIPVYRMMVKLHSYYPKRRDELVEILRIDLNWSIHQLSDGQRR